MDAEAHRTLEEDLPVYALGAMEAEEAKRIERHLRRCRRCRERLRWLAPALDALPASVERLEPPPGLRVRILASIREKEARPAHRLRRLALRPAAALAAVALLGAGIAGYAVRGGGEGATTVAVEGVGQASKATGTLVRHGDEGMLRVAGLPPLRGDEVYEVWVHRGSRVLASTVFVVRRDGTGAVAIPAQLSDADSVVVTREPSGGTRRPTSPAMLSARL